MSAQIYALPEGKEFVDAQLFNPDFIRKNRIAQIESKIEKKKDGDRIRDLFQSEVYSFYDSGQLQSVELIDHKNGDTTLTYYTYADDLIRCLIKNDYAGLYSYCYSYDDDLPSKIVYSRSTDIQTLTASVNPEFKKEVSEERIEHVQYENQLHTTYFNSVDRPYSKEIRYFDTNGYYVKYLKTFVMTSSSHKEEYKYNEKGYLSEKIVSENGDKNYRHTYEYDEIGNLLAENRYENGELLYRTENVLIPESMLLKARLTRNENAAHIIIRTFEYSYR
jgi:YD repeat-containing protein